MNMVSICSLDKWVGLECNKVVCVLVHYTTHSDGNTVNNLPPLTDSEAIKARALANVQSAFSNQETNQKSFMSITTNDLQETCEFSINF